MKLKKKVKEFFELNSNKPKFKAALRNHLSEKEIEKIKNILRVNSFHYCKVEDLYKFAFNKSVGSCLNCGKETKFGNDINRPREFCSKKCVRESPIIVSRRESACEAKYGKGITNSFKSDEVKKKIASTLLKRYGVDNPSKSKKLKKRKEKTSIKNFGTTHWTKNKKLMKKHKRNMLKEYGVENVMQLEEVRQKLRESLLEKYGVDNANYIPGVNEKRLKTYVSTCLKKYGVKNAIQDEDVFRKWMSSLCKKKQIVVNNIKLEVQGYEPNYVKKFEEYISKIKVPTFKIPYKQLGKERNYLPDLLIKSTADKTYLVEVKSVYTAKSFDLPYKIRAARKYCEAKGWILHLAVIEPANDNVMVYVNPTFSQVKAIQKALEVFSRRGRL